MVRHDVLGYVDPIDGAKLSRALDHGEQAEPVASDEGDRFREHIDVAQRRKFIEQQQDLPIEFRILFRQFTRVEVDHLLEKQVQKRGHAVEIVRRDAEIDRHRSLPQQSQIKIVGRRCGVDPRVEP